MTDPLASKSGQIAPKLRIDEEQKLVFIPGQDEPKELLPPIVQRTDKETGLPYQHIVTASEILEAKEQHERCMRFVRDALKAWWRCTQCQKIRPGTQLRPSGNMLELLGEMLNPRGVRVDWDSFVEHLGKHLLCKNPKCDAPCVVATREEYLRAREAEE